MGDGLSFMLTRVNLILPVIFTFQINGRVQENAQVLRGHSLLRPTVVDVPRQQHEIADKKYVQIGPVPV